MADSIDRILDALAVGMTDVVTARQLREIMLRTSGQIICRGRLRDIKRKSIGGGLYRLTLAAGGE